MRPSGHEGKAGRMTELIETAPKLDVASEEMAHVVAALRADHASDSPLLPRRAPRDAAHV
jgi:hypothetical protein